MPEELAIVEAYNAEREQRRIEQLAWIAEAFEEAFDEVEAAHAGHWEDLLAQWVRIRRRNRLIVSIVFAIALVVAVVLVICCHR